MHICSAGNALRMELSGSVQSMADALFRCTVKGKAAKFESGMGFACYRHSL